MEVQEPVRLMKPKIGVDDSHFPPPPFQHSFEILLMIWFAKRQNLSGVQDLLKKSEVEEATLFQPPPYFLHFLY
jgi:hypothetical protein